MTDLHRSRLEMEMDVLVCLADKPDGINHIIQRANLSFYAANEILAKFVSKGLAQRERKNGAYGGIYSLTENGLFFLKSANWAGIKTMLGMGAGPKQTVNQIGISSK